MLGLRAPVSHPGALTDNAPRCAHPHSPPATCPPQPTGAGRPSWSQVCPGKQTSAGTGSAVPAGDPPAAGGTAARQRNMSMDEPWPPPRLSSLGVPGILTREVFCTRNTRATKSSFAVPDTNSTSMRPYCCRPGSGQYCRQGWDTDRKLSGAEPVPTPVLALGIPPWLSAWL